MNFSSFLGGRGKRTVNKENEEDCLPKNTGNKRVTFDVQDGEDTENEQHSNRQPTPHPNKKLKGNDEEGGATRLPRPPPPAFHDGNGLVEDNQEDSRRAGNNDVEEGERFDQEDKPNENEEGANGDEEDDGKEGTANEMTEEEQEPTEEEKMWESLKEEKHGQGDEVFDCFLQGQERSKAANEALGNALRVFARKMEDNGNFFIQNLLGPIYDVQREKLHQLEADCKKLLIENHEKRTKYYKELDAAEKKISKNIRAMKALTLGIPESDDSNGDSSSPDKSTGSASPGVQEEDVIWDEILNDVHQDRASTAEVFLNAQQRLADAEARFEDAMHRIHSEWKAKIQAVADMVEDVHNEQNDKIEELDHFVRFKMVETDAREKEFAQLLEEAERKRQAYFSSLLGKVTSKASKLIGFGRNNASKGAN